MHGHGYCRRAAARVVSSGDTKATLLELENTGAMKYGISKSSLEDNKIGTDDITTVSFQIEHQQRKLLQLHRSTEAHHQL